MATDDDLRRKPDPRLHLELGLLKLVTAKRLAPLEEILAEFNESGGKKPAAPATKSFAASASAATAPTVEAVTPTRNSPTSGKASSETPEIRGRYDSPAGMASAPAQTGLSDVSGARNVPAAALPPRVVASSMETTTSGLAAAQFEAIKAALQEQKFLSSMVEYVTRWELEGNEMRLFFPTDKRTLAEMLQARDAMERLRNVASRVIGQPLRVCVKLESARPGNARPSDLRAHLEQDPIVRAMLDRFGGRISEVKRRGEE